MGVQPDESYPEVTLALAPGDSFICYSDGIVEGRNGAGSLFEEQRLIEAVRTLGGQDSREIVNGIFQAVDGFAAGAPAEDDRTVIVVQATP